LKIGRSALGLLAYLALYASHPLPREKVSAELWPECDPDRARSRLSTALWRLRTALGKDRCGSVVTEGGEAAIGLTPAVLDAVDTRRFEAEARRFLADNDGARDWRDGADDAGPRGEPLAGWYSVWALSARVRLEDLGERCLTVLLERQYAAGADLAAIETAERLLQIDTLREDVHQALMRIYLRQGITGLAARQYERCRLTLAEELGVEPTAETKALRAGIAQPCSRPHRPAFDPALGTVAGKDLQGVRKAISETQRGLTRLSHKLDTLDRFQS
jgi:DNA-binding SARP family transcriptional activator